MTNTGERYAMLPADRARLQRLADLSWHLSHRITEAEAAHNDVLGKRLANTLRDVCREMVPLLYEWERDPRPVLRDLSDITEEVEQTEFRLRPDGKGYEPR
jgi:hypothetical protein